MKQTLALIKVLFKQNYRRGKNADRSKKGKIGMALLYVFCFVVLAPYLIISLISLSSFAINANAGREYLSILMLSIQTMALIFGTYSLVNVIFFSKDNEIISSLPIPTRRVFVAKFMFVTIQELVIAAVVGLAGVGIYGYMSGAVISFYLLGSAAVLVSPIIAIAFSSIIVFPIILICAVLRKSPILSGGVIALLFGGGMYLYMHFILGISSGMTNSNMDNAILFLFEMVADKLFFNMIVADVVFLTSNWIVSLAYTALLYVGMFLLALVVTSLVYNKGVSLSIEKQASKEIQSTNNQNSVLKAMIIRDFKSIVRFPILLFTCVAQIITSPLMVYVMAKMYSDGMDSMQFTMTFMMGTMFVCGMNYFASTSFTRENDSFNILKTLPVSVNQIVVSKLIIAYICSVITSIVTVAVCLISGMSVVLSSLLLAYFLCLSLGICAWQIRCDLDKPKLGWSNVNEGMKNNKSATIPLFATMGIGIVGMIALLIVSFTKPSLTIAIVIIFILLSAIFAILQLRTLFKKAEYLFVKVEY